VTFGDLLKRFRDERQFTLRDLSKLSDIDHAYIHRLETGEKEAPSNEIVKSLVKALKIDSRRAHILEFLVGRVVDDLLVNLVLEDPEHALEDFASAAQMSFRGSRPSTKDAWIQLLGRIKRTRQEFEKDG
jgi:HTH-type transcriptional regulator, competence development regulator